MSTLPAHCSFHPFLARPRCTPTMLSHIALFTHFLPGPAVYPLTTLFHLFLTRPSHMPTTFSHITLFTRSSPGRAVYPLCSDTSVFTCSLPGPAACLLPFHTSLLSPIPRQALTVHPQCFHTSLLSPNSSPGPYCTSIMLLYITPFTRSHREPTFTHHPFISSL